MVAALARSIMCRLNRHRPVRRAVDWDGRRYVGSCSDCGDRIYRLKSHEWRRAR